MVQSPKLSVVIPVSSVNMSQFKNSTSCSAIADTLVEHDIPVLQKFRLIYSMKTSMFGEVVVTNSVVFFYPIFELL